MTRPARDTRQSRRMSLIEAIVNVIAGYVLAIATQVAVYPWFGLEPSLGENLAIGAIFVGISLLRSYTLRRLFEALRLCQELNPTPRHDIDASLRDR